MIDPSKDFANGKVLVVVFDGLRPDRVTPAIMPNLHRFLGGAALFPNTGSAFPSETRVQVSTVMSGHPPAGRRGGHGIMGNSFYDPALGFDGPMDTSNDPLMKAAHAIYGRLFGAAHMSEILFGAGKRFAALTTGKVGNARLLAGRAAELGQPVLSIHGDIYSTPQADYAAVVERFGACPEMRFPNVEAIDWASRVFLEHTLADHRPDFAVLWLNEPDLSYHYHGIASPEAIEAQAACDAGFGRILDCWQAEGRAQGYRIVTMSDHGHITVEGQVDVMRHLLEAGLSVGKAIGPDVDFALKPGYSGQISVRDRDPALVERMVRTLTEQDWCGPIFARDTHISGGLDRRGVLPLSRVNYAHPRAADIAFTLRGRRGAWSRDGSAPVEGLCLADNADIPIGGGLHGGLMRGELNHLLAIGGDGIRPGTIETPCGNIDVAPTALALMGLEPDPMMAGRALLEALPGGAVPETVPHEIEAGDSGPGANGYRQILRLSEVKDRNPRLNGCWYLREGLRLDGAD
jgi:hypothetical protein